MLLLAVDPERERVIFETSVYPDPNCGCWIWLKGIRPDGYGQLQINGRFTGAHRAMWQFRHGPMAADKLACHICDTPLCVNPDHVWPGSHADNSDDKLAKGRSRNNPFRPVLSVRRATTHTAALALSDPTVPIGIAMKMFRQAYKRTGEARKNARLGELLTMRVRGGQAV